jgi:hypothetical protein
LGVSVANHQGARTGDVAQRLEHAFTAAFLNYGDQHRDGGEGEQYYRFDKIAEHEIGRSRAKQQREHRLADHAEHDSWQGAPVWARQLVRPLVVKAARSFLGGESLSRKGHFVSLSIWHRHPAEN